MGRGVGSAVSSTVGSGGRATVAKKHLLIFRPNSSVLEHGYVRFVEVCTGPFFQARPGPSVTKPGPARFRKFYRQPGPAR
jgi:hypothetical protein